MAEPVSVIIPTYNEEDHIDGVLATLADQTYGAANLEVLVIDGRSLDATRELASAWADRLQIRVLDNPKRQQGAALNIGLRTASHELIVRLDAHALYADDYVERCVFALEESDATMVGGPMRPKGQTPFGTAVALATTTPIGVGPGRFHYSERREFVDTVFLGAFRRSEILAIGGYDELMQQAAEDHELAYRIARSGGKILLDPTIRSTYFPRSDPGALFKQYHNYGLGKASTLDKHRSLPTWRPLAPAGLIAWLVLGPLMMRRKWSRLLFFGSLVSYTGVVGVTSMRASRGDVVSGGQAAGAIVLMHAAYGFGFWRGIFRILGKRNGETQ